jgi:hypothetical protein
MPEDKMFVDKMENAWRQNVCRQNEKYMCTQWQSVDKRGKCL